MNSKKKKKFKKGISILSIPPEHTIKFSFKFYDTSNQKYCLSAWGKEEILKTLKRLQEINSKTFNELRRDRVVYNFHPVPWGQTTMPSGFPSHDANRLESFQFSLLGINNQRARVFGAYSRDTFYIVWFDYNHSIYPSSKKHT